MTTVGASLRLGLIGAGRWGRTLARVISALPGMHLAAIATTHPSSNTDLSGSVLVPSWEALLRMPLDGLIVATPPYAHDAPSLAALAQGLPVMIEKPMTLSVPAAEQIVDAALLHGTPVLVDHTQLFAPGVIALRARLHALGGPSRLVLHAGAWGPFRTDVPVLWDWGAHDVALACHLTALASGVSGLHPEGLVQRRWRTKDRALAESVALSLRSPKCRISVRVANCLAAKERFVEAHAGDAVLVYREYPSPRLVLREKSTTTELSFRQQGPLDGALEEFARRIREGDASQDSVQLGAEVVRVLSEADALARCSANRFAYET